MEGGLFQLKEFGKLRVKYVTKQIYMDQYSANALHRKKEALKKAQNNKIANVAGSV